jgi:dimethylhistidine N-methyltransferase
MAASVKAGLSQFALDVASGLSCATQKKIVPRYFYDDLGSSLFEAITLLPEYGLTRADERLLGLHSNEIARETGPMHLVAELGSGTGKKTRRVLEALSQLYGRCVYRPIDVSLAALAACERDLSGVADVRPVCADWEDGLATAVRFRAREKPLLVLFLGSSIGNLDRERMLEFLRELRSRLRPGDFFLLGADLVKDVDTMLAAYDDPTGVTAAFNLNVLGRMNRELGANFDMRAFAHEVRWDSARRRIEMHLVSRRDQTVYLEALQTVFEFQTGETIWTESSHKFTAGELDSYAYSSGFCPIRMWIDEEWPFAEALWQAL